MHISSWFTYGLAKGAVTLIRVMPSSPAHALGQGLGVLAWLLDTFHRRTAEIQMRGTLGRDYSRCMPLKVFMHHGIILVDAIQYAFMDAGEIKKRIVIEGRQHIEKALASGRGVMLIEGHIGNWEITMHIPKLIDIEFSTMMNERKDAGLESLIQELRTQTGIRRLPPKGGMIETLVTAMKQGKSIFMAIDQRGPRKNTFRCNLLGLPALTSLAPAFIAIKGDALVVPVSIIRVSGVYHVRFEKPWDSREFCTDTLTNGSRVRMKDPSVKRLSASMQDWMNSVIREYPEQWIWLYSRWTRRSEMRRLIESKKGLREYLKEQVEE